MLNCAVAGSFGLGFSITRLNPLNFPSLIHDNWMSNNSQSIRRSRHSQVLYYVIPLTFSSKHSIDIPLLNSFFAMLWFIFDSLIASFYSAHSINWFWTFVIIQRLKYQRNVWLFSDSRAHTIKNPSIHSTLTIAFINWMELNHSNINRMLPLYARSVSSASY